MPETDVTQSPPRQSSSSNQPVAAFQGIRGAFGETAIHALWPSGAHPKCERTFRDAVDAAVEGRADWVVLPVWNSTIGDIGPACAELRRAGDAVVVERSVDIPVLHCLMALPGTSLDEVRYVGSHPAALGQCSAFFSAHPSILELEASDTAGAALELANWHSPSADHEPWFHALSLESPRQLASIGSERAAELYGLVILLRNVQNDAANLTRFVAARRAR